MSTHRPRLSAATDTQPADQRIRPAPGRGPRPTSPAPWPVAVTAVRDPDGNLVELTQLGPSWLDHLQARRAEGHDLIARWTARRADGPAAGSS